MVSVKRRIVSIGIIGVLSILGVWVYYERKAQVETLWKKSVLPGELSMKHASLEKNCGVCHEPIYGVTAVNCIQCHASETELLKRQPTAFHASIGECVGCHVEHRGRSSRLTTMDHEVLASLGLKKIDTKRGETGLIEWLRSMTGEKKQALMPHSDLSIKEASLHCATCHANQDRHVKLFGEDCSQCHAVKTWKITSYRHPAASSRDCSQCHQAPPSHYMEHFRMISMRVAHVEHADVRQCYLCHQTTSWNDIKAVGWYKHH